MFATTTVDDALRRIKNEYLELPGLRLTLAQVQRLWHLDDVRSRALVSALVDVNFLRRDRDGRFVRADL